MATFLSRFSPAVGMQLAVGKRVSHLQIIWFGRSSLLIALKKMAALFTIGITGVLYAVYGFKTSLYLHSCADDLSVIHDIQLKQTHLLQKNLRMQVALFITLSSEQLANQCPALCFPGMSHITVIKWQGAVTKLSKPSPWSLFLSWIQMKKYASLLLPFGGVIGYSAHQLSKNFLSLISTLPILSYLWHS